MAEENVKREQLTLDGDAVAFEYPKSFTAFSKWVGAVTNQDLLDEGEKLLFGNSIKAILYFSPRVLYDFFDERGLSVNVHQGEGGGWVYFIYEGLHSYAADSRIKAEGQAFLLAFKLLEEKL